MLVVVVLVALVVVVPVVLVVLAVLLSVLLVPLACLVVVGVTVSVLPGLSVVQVPGLSLRLVVVHCGWSGLRLRMLGSPVRARLLLRGQASWRPAVVAVV